MASDRTGDRRINEGIARLIARRRGVFKAEQAGISNVGTMHVDATHAEPAPGDTREAPDRWAIALSGGGIRSATFSLGVMQAIARAPAHIAEPATTGAGSPPDAPSDAPHDTPPDTPARRSFAASFLSRFDYLSTVSGGGCLGGFVASLFVPGRLYPRLKGAGQPTIDSGETLRAADAGVAALSSDPPGRISCGSSGGPRTPATFPLTWLRENGRYLSPTGAGDTAYVAGLDLRNWVAVHYVVGTVLVALFALLALARYPLWATGFDPIPSHAVAGWTVWFSPLLWLTLALWVLPVGVAFWFTYPSKRGGARTLNWAVLGALGVDVLLAALVYVDWRSPWDPARHPRPLPLLFGMMAITLGLGWYLWDRWRHGAENTVAAIRVRTTRQLVSGLQWTAVILALGLLESAGQSLYLASFDPRFHSPTVWGTSGAAAALAWIAKQLAKGGSASKEPGWWRRWPWPGSPGSSPASSTSPACNRSTAPGSRAPTSAPRTAPALAALERPPAQRGRAGRGRRRSTP